MSFNISTNKFEFIIGVNDKNNDNNILKPKGILFCFNVPIIFMMNHCFTIFSLCIYYFFKCHNLISFTLSPFPTYYSE